MAKEPREDLDELWGAYMGKHTTPMQYRADVLAQGRIHQLREILEHDLASMYQDTGEMSLDEIKQVAGEIYRALEVEKGRQGADERRAEKIRRRGPQIFRH